MEVAKIDEESFGEAMPKYFIFSTSQQFNNSTLSKSEALVEVDTQYFRPTEVEILLGDPSKAKEKLGWKPEYAIDELVQDMVKSDKKT